MAKSLRRTDKEIAELYERHVETVYRVCFAYMKNAADADDMMQDAFVNLIKRDCVFVSADHERAWLIRTASNLCKNSLRHWWRKRENLEDFAGLQFKQPSEVDETFEVIMSPPDKYKTVIYMHYYEGYTSAEIARALSKPQNTILGHLREARTILKNKLGEDSDHEETDNRFLGENQTGPDRTGTRAE